MTTIITVTVISQSEQIAWVQTSNGHGYIVTPIPDARGQYLHDLNWLAQVDTVREAEEWFRRNFS